MLLIYVGSFAPRNAFNFLDQLKAYIEAHNLPRHPLVKDGYLSIGCMPCTNRVEEGGDYRSGRWADSDKDECGIHLNVDGDGI
mgnify:CR=1 FL=1